MGRAPEWRFDPLTGRTVLIAPERAERPLETGLHCPFCEGNESETPPEVRAYRDPNSAPNGPGWRVRVVPNRYAAVRLDADRGGGTRLPPNASGATPAEAEFRRQAASPAVGVAEVFIECPQHETKFRNLSRNQFVAVLRAWRDRLKVWSEDGRIRYLTIFKNEGRGAGASVEHCHSQLIGVADIPITTWHEEGPIRGSGQRRDECALCHDLRSGAQLAMRLVAESPRFLAICPVAPRMPGELWICPRKCWQNFYMADDEIVELTDVLRDLLTRVAAVFGDPDFNMIVKTAPFRTEGASHWRIEILPRTTRIAGWELGTGIFINTLFPEDAARLLRDAG